MKDNQKCKEDLGSGGFFFCTGTTMLMKQLSQSSKAERAVRCLQSAEAFLLETFDFSWKKSV